MQTLKDSGERQAFNTGAVRDTATGKPRLELISPFFEERLARWLTLGAEKYEPRNWEQGMPIERCIASLLRHINAYRQGATDEDHLAAAACNLMFIMHYEAMITRGVLSADLNNMPNYLEVTH